MFRLRVRTRKKQATPALQTKEEELKLKHTTRCSECPWRKDSPAGWLGGWSPEFYTDAVQNNEVPACHLQDHGLDSDDTAMCAGALSVMANACISAWKTEGGDEAKQRVGKRDDTFQHPALFYKHHAGQEYVHPLMRKKSA